MGLVHGILYQVAVAVVQAPTVVMFSFWFDIDHTRSEVFIDSVSVDKDKSIIPQLLQS